MVEEPILIFPKLEVIEPASRAPTVVTLERVSRFDSIKVSKSDIATCTIVPASLTTTLSAATRVVLVAEVLPSTILSSAAVDATFVPPISSVVTEISPSTVITPSASVNKFVSLV